MPIAAACAPAPTLGESRRLSVRSTPDRGRQPDRQLSPRDDTPALVRATCRAIEAAQAPPRLTSSRAG
jgi:hypothetical protein